MPMEEAEAIRRINNDELNCPECKSDIIAVQHGKEFQFKCMWCKHEWNEEEVQDEPSNNRPM